ncbi:acyltransferase family protein [Gorillibacterium timonense]|uniref:acyltransferase family protein n=1 Tax=Gorillibacterium timonense TaxID=1689269 RepID=UPI00071C30A6|nr:acyltransferase [Gorillibacterium timonense]
MGRLAVNFSQVNERLDGRASAYLDSIRFGSAVLVVMEHLGSRLFVGYGEVERPGPVVQLLYLLHLLGGPAVIVFFVLSGLFISRSVLHAFLFNRWSWKAYLINRFSRLYVVLIPALLLTFAADHIASRFYSYPGYTSRLAELKDFVGNLLFLQANRVSSYGSNGPLWSLAYEFWYYLLFPLVLLALLRTTRAIRRVGVIILAAGIMLFVGNRVSLYFVIWLLGTALLVLPGGQRDRSKTFAWLTGGLLGAAMLMRPLVQTGRLFPGHGSGLLFLVDVAIGLSFAGVISFLIHGRRRIGSLERREEAGNHEPGKFEKTAKKLAGFTFTLYLVHYPIINLVYHWRAAHGFRGLQPGLGTVALELLLIAALCGAAYLISLVTEAKTDKIRSVLLRRRASLASRRETRVTEA